MNSITEDLEKVRQALRPFSALADRATVYRHEPDSTCEWRIKAADLFDAREALAMMPGLIERMREMDAVMGCMTEFSNSEYSPRSGWTRDQYQAAKEATEHWPGMLRGKPRPLPKPPSESEDSDDPRDYGEDESWIQDADMEAR